MRTRTVLATATVAAALVVPSSASAAGENQNCFGALASSGAQADGGNGTFVSGAARFYKGPDNGSIGQDGVPALKAIACGGGSGL